MGQYPIPNYNPPLSHEQEIRINNINTIDYDTPRGQISLKPITSTSLNNEIPLLHLEHLIPSYYIRNYSSLEGHKVIDESCNTTYSDIQQILECTKIYQDGFRKREIQLRISNLKIHGYNTITSTYDKSINQAGLQVIRRYDLLGRELNTIPHNQFFIEQYSDGSTNRIFVP